MLKGFLRRPSNAFLIALCAALTVALVAVSLSPQSPFNHGPNINAEQNSDESIKSKQQTHNTKPSINHSSQSYRDDRRDETSEYWTVFGRRLKITDTLLVIFAFTLWWATRELVVGAEETAERELRAYISVETGMTFRQSKKHQARFEFRPVIVNNGKTPASNVRILSRIDFITPPVPPNFNYALVSPASLVSVLTIGPGKDKFHISIIQRHLSWRELREHAKGTKRFHLWGQVIYEDIFKIERHTYFSFLIFVPTSKRNQTLWLNTEHHNHYD